MVETFESITRGIKFIRLPKINNNLLSVISLFLLLTMMFLAVSVIADHCEELREKYRDAQDALAFATWGVHSAAMAATISCGITIRSIWVPPFAISAGLGCLMALGSWAAAIWWYHRKADRFEEAFQKWKECLESHPNADSGSCDSGGDAAG